MYTANAFNGSYTFFIDGQVQATCTVNHLMSADRCKDEYRKAVTVSQAEQAE